MSKNNKKEKKKYKTGRQTDRQRRYLRSMVIRRKISRKKKKTRVQGSVHMTVGKIPRRITECDQIRVRKTEEQD